MRLLIVCTVLLPSTLACFASGVCGGGPSPCFAPPPPIGGLGGGCTTSSCAPGYSCGAYGCFRRRARAHATLTAAAPEDYGEESPSATGPQLYGRSRFAQFRKPSAAATPVQEIPSDPNAAFMACCESRGLPDACLAKCSFQTYTKQSLTSMYFKQDACPIEASAEIQFCAAQGRDHRACCARNGVSTTLAGEKCLTFCDQRPGNVTMLDFSYVSCYERFDNMKSCFWHDLSQRLRK